VHHRRRGWCTGCSRANWSSRTRIGYHDIRPDGEDNSGDDDREDADAQQSIVILISPEGTVGADERVGGEQCEQHERRGEMDRDDFCGQLALNRDLAELVLDGE